MRNFTSTKIKIDIKILSDTELLELCKKYGTQSILWKRKFIGLLPEVDCRGLYLKKGFSSVHEFAAKTAGISFATVQRVINIYKRLEESGLYELRDKLVHGEVSLHKLARVVSIANFENESECVRAVEKLSQSAVEVLVRDERAIQMEKLFGNADAVGVGGEGGGETASGAGIGGEGGEAGEGADLFGSENCGENVFVRAHKSDCMINRVALQDLQALELDEIVVARLKELKNQGCDINILLMGMLDKRESEIENKLDEIGDEVVQNELERIKNGEEIRRYIPTKVKKAIAFRAGKKCEVKFCKNEAKHFHHVVRFGIQKTHDPRCLVQLCSEHHQITHAMDEVYLERKLA